MSSVILVTESGFEMTPRFKPTHTWNVEAKIQPGMCTPTCANVAEFFPVEESYQYIKYGDLCEKFTLHFCGSYLCQPVKLLKMQSHLFVFDIGTY